MCLRVNEPGSSFSREKGEELFAPSEELSEEFRHCETGSPLLFNLKGEEVKSGEEFLGKSPKSFGDEPSDSSGRQMSLPRGLLGWTTDWFNQHSSDKQYFFKI